MATTSTTKKAQRPTHKARRGWNPTVKELEDIEKEYQPIFDKLRKMNLP